MRERRQKRSESERTSARACVTHKDTKFHRSSRSTEIQRGTTGEKGQNERESARAREREKGERKRARIYIYTYLCIL